MNDASDARLEFRDRYIVESFSNGDGLLVDARTGSYFKLNATAVQICQALNDVASADEAVERVAKRMEIPVLEAARLVTLVMADLQQGRVAEGLPGPLRYLSQPDGSAVFEEDGRPIFSIERGAHSVRFRASLSDLTGPLVLYLQALVPKLLSILEVPVLHAASCRIAGEVVAFSGKSGAGKTTTARAFDRAGAPLISEDLLVLSLGDESPVVYLAGEAAARDWARGVVPQLERSPDRPLSFVELSDAQRGATSPLDAIWFVDVRRREGGDINLRALSVTDGALALVGNGLLATTEHAHWHNFLSRSRRIAERTQLCEATMPAGVDQLEEATKRYIVNSAS